jgi:Uma2 family endonuclease
MQVASPELRLPSRLLDDDEYFEFCVAHPDRRFERTPEGRVIIVPPAGWESGFQAGEAFRQLANWAIENGKGRAVSASAQYILPNRAGRSPDASWISNHRIDRLSKEQKRKFPPACPEFVIEVMSPSDRLAAAKRKMEEYMQAGVDLGWLIHGDKQTVYIYRAGQKSPETRMGIEELAGEGPVAGFKLDLRPIWAGL